MGADLYWYEKKTRKEHYFRDPYNSTNVLWRYGLSWQKDVSPMLNAKGELSVKKAKKLLGMIERQGLKVPTKQELEGFACVDEGSNSVKKWHSYYRKVGRELKDFLKGAISEGVSIYCSF